MNGARGPAYRPDIDGLRALAVIAVVAFHAFPSLVPGGFVGVDVFFVISGYLISGIILGALAADRFSFREFYARRIRRIFPALAVVLAAVYAAGWFVMFADDYQQLSRHIVAGVAFVSNFALWSEAGYFDDAADTKPLQHLWSLGIEEQFYLAWPLVLYLTWRRMNPLWPTLAITGLSFALNLHHVRTDLVGTFYSPLTRFWELLAGALLACVVVAPPAFVRPWQRRLAAWGWLPDAAAAAGTLMIAAPFALLHSGRLFPGLWAVLPTGGAFLILAAGPRAWLNRAVLSNRAMVGIGLISYPLYLWHWPLLSFARLVAGEPPSPAVRVAMVAASVVLSAATYAAIEKPIRFGRLRRRAVPALSLAMAGILAAGVYTYQSGGLIERRISRSDRAHFIQYYDRMHKRGLAGAYRAECDFMDWPSGQVKASIDPSCTVAGAGATWFLWGDSYAQALSAGLRALAPDGTSVAQVTTSLCRPAIAEVDTHVPDGRCVRANGFALERIAALRPDVVILAQMNDHPLTDWAALTARLVALGAGRVVLVGPVPQWRPSLPEVVTTHYWGAPLQRAAHGLVADVLSNDRAAAERTAAVAHLAYASVVDRLCNGDGCLAVVPDSPDGDLIAVDSGHLTPSGSVFVVREVLSRYLLPSSP